MSPRVARVFKGYSSLTDAEKNELIRAINASNGTPEQIEKTARDLKESLDRIPTGPYAQGRCDCCGK
jgi:hypothetical protein